MAEVLTLVYLGGIFFAALMLFCLTGSTKQSNITITLAILWPLTLPCLALMLLAGHKRKEPNDTLEPR